MTTTEILKDYIIYKIYCKNKEITDEYYGHTCAFRNRKYKHKNYCNNEKNPAYNTDKYKFIRLNGGWSNWNMVPIEEIKSCSLVNARIREQFYIDLNKSEMNKNKAYITEEQKIERDKQYRLENRDTIKQYYLENRDKILEKNKEYRLENRDKILEKAKEYHLENRDKNLEKMKEKYLENRDKNLDYQKEYRLENRDKILEHNKEKITCICSKTFTRNYKSQHERTQFHCKFIQSAM